MTSHGLEALFNPKSVAVIGASCDPTRIGGRPVRYLKESGFDGAIYPVNPKQSDIQGLPAFVSVDEIDEEIDAAIVALPPGPAMAAVRACAARGVRQLVMFSAGFAEVGPEGVALQEELTNLARTSGMRVLGPNCLGAFNTHSGAFLTFSGVFDDVVGSKGRFGLVSQSGGYAGELLKRAVTRGVDFGTWVTTGNEADLTLGEVFEAMAHDPNTDAILGYVEGVRDAESFIAGLKAAQIARKPVILQKVGRTAEGAAAAASHTAALAGSDDVYDEIFREFGVYRAHTTGEMLDVAYATKRGVFPERKRLAIVTNSGGLGIQAADYANETGLEIPAMPQPLQDKIVSVLPNAAPANPVDVTGQVANQPDDFGDIVDLILAEGDYDATYINIGLIGGLPFLVDPLVKAFGRVAANHPEKLIAVTVTAAPEVIARYEAAGLLAFDDPSAAVRGISALAMLRDGWERAGRTAKMPASNYPRLEEARAYSEVEGKALLAKIGVPSPFEMVFEGADSATGLPDGRYAVKVVSADIMHKSDVGGVALGIESGDVSAAIEKISASVTKSAPDARVTGFIASQMVGDGVDCILGVHRDPLFGPVMMFGLGGVMVELFKDATLRRVPVTPETAKEMIRSIRAWPLLDGYRGSTKADHDALAEVIVKVSEFAAANADIAETIEINPLRVMPVGQGTICLDAVIQTRGA